MLATIALTTAGAAQTWRDHPTRIELPTDRTVPHPFSVLASRTGRVLLAWIEGAGGRGAMHVAAFRGTPAAWEAPTRVLDMRRPCRPALFELGGRPHLLETGSGKRYFARLHGDRWKPLPYPLPRRGNPRDAVAVSVADGGAVLAWIHDVRQVSRTPTRQSLTSKAGKVFVRTLDANGKAGKRVSIDGTSRGLASLPAIDARDAERVDVVFERRLGSTAKSNIAHATRAKRKTPRPVSHEPGRAPSVASTPSGALALWQDRRGVVLGERDGKTWRAPVVFAPRATHGRIVRLEERVVVATWIADDALVLRFRRNGAWGDAVSLGPARGPAEVVRDHDGVVHVIWEAPGRFRHRSLAPAPAPSTPQQGR